MKKYYHKEEKESKPKKGKGCDSIPCHQIFLYGIDHRIQLPSSEKTLAEARYNEIEFKLSKISSVLNINDRFYQE